MLLAVCCVLICLVVGSRILLGQAKFGKNPEGERLERIQTSPNYKDGEFVNVVPTQTLADGESTMRILWKDFFSGASRLRPAKPLPVVKTDIKSLDDADDMAIWLGHSSFFIQLAGKRIAVDPVFSEYGAPFSFLNRVFAGANPYAAADMPEIDILLVTHDHWDHLDYPTVEALMAKVGTVVVPLGVGAHFERWGYPKEKLREVDWNARLQFDGLTVYATPARHYSGRLFAQNKTLWAGFVLETSNRRIFISGDTGYGPHFAQIAQTFKGFDLVMLDGGQYDPRWPLIHMTPEEAARAAEELAADALLLGHVGKFSIARHPWDEPFIRAARACENKAFTLVTPRIGEPVRLDGKERRFERWWVGLD